MSAPLDAALARALFDAPLLRGLGERDRALVLGAAKSRRLEASEVIYGAGAPADSVFVVLRGAVQLLGERRGDQEASVIRVARAGESFGEDALLLHGGRGLTASAKTQSEVVEVAASVLERALGRSGERDVASRELRFAERAAMSDLLRTVAFARELGETDHEMLLDGCRPRSVERGESVYRAGAAAESFFMIVEGLVQLQSMNGDTPEVRAYLGRGDFFGDEELFSKEPRRLSAVASGVSELVEVKAEVLRTLTDRNPRLLGRVRRIQTDRAAEQERALSSAGGTTTQHVFRDAYRMQMARSLLVIDQDTCVRCGHCAWTCESLYGVSRLVRAGDKILVDDSGDTASRKKRSLMLPNSCQHCRNPLCMVDCPTGAIGRDPEGEVFIREELCIGCGNCAKACPWDNIRMAPRPTGATVAESVHTAPSTDSVHRAELAASAEVAVKCDLCRTYDAPACVSACPTEAIFRLEPTQDISEVAALFGADAPATSAPTLEDPTKRRVGLAVAAGSGLSLGLLFAGWRAHSSVLLEPGRGVGLLAGWGALLILLALISYSVPKRLTRLWLRRREKRGARGEETRRPARSRVRPYYRLHIVLGLLGAAAVFLHGGPALEPTAAGALGAVFWLVCAFGVLGAALYRFVPSRLSRLERRGTLPEDIEAERERLVDRMHREATGRSDLVKALLDKMLLPYARSTFGPLALLVSARSRKEEERRVEAQVHALLEGRGEGKLVGLDELIRTVVELRALPVRRVLSRLIRDWLMLHIVLSGVLIGLLGVHLFGVLS